MKHSSSATTGPLNGADNLIGSMYVDLYPHETALIQLSGGYSSDIDSTQIAAFDHHLPNMQS